MSDPGPTQPRMCRARPRWGIISLFFFSFPPGLLIACGSDFNSTESSGTSAGDGGGVGGAGGTSSSHMGGGGGGTGGTKPECVPSSTNKVDDDCGIFVSSSLGKDSNDGSKEAPVNTLGHAIEIADGKPIYACGEEFVEVLTVPSGSILFGALDCAADWAYDEAKPTQLTAAADAIPLRLEAGGDTTRLFDFQVTSKHATKGGGSSIAALAEGGEITLERVSLVAGSGTSGANGTTPDTNLGSTNPDDDTIKGESGINACVDSNTNDGGLPKENPFCDFASGGPIGGGGGAGKVPNGGAGDAQPANDQTALGGTGQPNDSTPMDCSPGANGATNGKSGDVLALAEDGAGAKGDDALGTLDASGYKGVAGSGGERGRHGQGGGGGGGAAGKTGPNCAGASGGGGGAGGCGGFGGTGGKAGGASIGLVSLGAKLTLNALTVKTAVGGAGGDGATGQFGGVGGTGGARGLGSGTDNACSGGSGGDGGRGGQGGGGRGGHTIGVAFTGEEPDTSGVTFELGEAGPGGHGADLAHDGDDGVTANTQVFAE